VLALARDLDTPERRDALLGGIPEPLRADPGRAWRAFASALLADALADD
jgi:hypothetical protein